MLHTSGIDAKQLEIEFLQVPPHKLPQLMNSFRLFDADGSCQLNRSEAMAAMMSVNPMASPSQMQSEIQAADARGDHNNEISFAEFCILSSKYMK